eukprot:1159275-Pelagomonas_calceolata.AAC.5
MAALVGHLHPGAGTSRDIKTFPLPSAQKALLPTKNCADLPHAAAPFSFYSGTWHTQGTQNATREDANPYKSNNQAGTARARLVAYTFCLVQMELSPPSPGNAWLVAQGTLKRCPHTQHPHETKQAP